MNHLIGQKIAITSNKPQTTRNKIQTVYTCDEGQIVFLDTPGIHKAKNKLGEYMVQVAERTLKEVDAIMWLVEPSTFVGAGERHIAEQLQKVGVPVILIINKIDTVKKENPSALHGNQEQFSVLSEEDVLRCGFSLYLFLHLHLLSAILSRLQRSCRTPYVLHGQTCRRGV